MLTGFVTENCNFNTDDFLDDEKFTPFPKFEHDVTGKENQKNLDKINTTQDS